MLLFQSKNQRYLQMLERAKMMDAPDFAKLRKIFAMTELYDPYDSQIADWREKARTAWGKSEFAEVVRYGKQILEKNFIDLEAHFLLWQAMKQLGKNEQADYHLQIFSGLCDSIRKSGDGKTPQTAFQLLSADEETIFLRSMNLKFKEAKRMQIDNSRFDVVLAEEQKSQTAQKLYFNIDIPYQWMQKRFS